MGQLVESIRGRKHTNMYSNLGDSVLQARSAVQGTLYLQLTACNKIPTNCKQL